VHVDKPESMGPHSIRLGLSREEWREFQDCVRRHYANLEDFFTQKALELIALGRERAGQRPN